MFCMDASSGQSKNPHRVANGISSASSKEAPLSWFGGTFGSLLGLGTSRNLSMAEVLTRMATEIDTLKMNNEK